MNYAGRVHCDDQQQSALIQGLKDRCDNMIVYRHDTFHPHIHFLMMNTKCSYDTLVNVVKRVIPGATKDKYSFKKDANDDFISYMSKGKLDPVYTQGYSQELIQEKKLKGFDKTDRLQTSKPTESKKSAQITNHQLITEIAARMFDKQGLDVNADAIPPYDFENIYDATTETLKSHKKGGDIYYVMKMMETVLMVYYPDSHRHFVKAAWNSRHKLNSY